MVITLFALEGFHSVHVYRFSRAGTFETGINDSRAKFLGGPLFYKFKVAAIAQTLGADLIAQRAFMASFGNVA